MATCREPDAIAALLEREHQRVLGCLSHTGNGGRKSALSEARRILCALGSAETEVLYPAFSRVALRLETQRLLDDCRGSRAEQLAALDVLMRVRARRLRTLAAVALCDRIAHHGEQHISLLLPVLASQLPRPVYRSIGLTFTARYDSDLRLDAPTLASEAFAHH